MSRFVLGLDLGQAGEFTALSVLEREGVANPQSLAVRHLVRFAPGSTYTEIAAATGAVVTNGNLGHPPVVADLTAVGPGLLTALRTGVPPAWIIPVMLTASGTAAKDDNGTWRLPKRDLVTALQLELQGRRLRVAPGLPDAELLVRELTTFRAQIALAPTDAADWRNGPTDDLVFAVGLATWWAVKHPFTGTITIEYDRSFLHEMLDRVFPEFKEHRRW